MENFLEEIAALRLWYFSTNKKINFILENIPLSHLLNVKPLYLCLDEDLSAFNEIDNWALIIRVHTFIKVVL